MRYILLFVGIATFFLNSCQKKVETQIDENSTYIQKINIHTLKKQSYPLWVSFSGKTEAFESVDTISRVKGELKEISFVEGEFVDKGDVLFRLDKSEYVAKYNQQKAILEKDKASLALAKATFDRYKPLVDEQLVSKEKIEQLDANIQELRAIVKADKALLDEVKLNLDYCDIKATIDGYVGKSSYLKGNLINIGDKLTNIVNSKKLYVHFYPSIEDVVLIKKFAKEPFCKVKVVLDKDDFKSVVLSGRVDFIDNRANSSTNTVSMRAIISNDDTLVYAGSFVHIWLHLGEYEALAIEPNQVSQDQEGEFVYIVDENNTLRKRYVQIGFENSSLMFVSNGLKSGDRVVVGLFHSLEEGRKVEPVEVENPIKVEM